MKEAAGEANMTVITIILIGIIVAIATPIVNSMMTTAEIRSCCQNAGGYIKDDGNCSNGNSYSKGCSSTTTPPTTPTTTPTTTPE